MILAKTNGETLQEHIHNCLTVFNSLKQLYPNLFTDSEWELLEQAVKSHDLGKINDIFQSKIKNGGRLPTFFNVKEIPHNYLSPAMIDKHARTDEAEQIILINSVFYHHVRDEPDWEQIKSYIKTELQSEWNTIDFQSDFLCKKLRTSFSNQVKALTNPEKISPAQQLRYILIKGSLNRIDYCASAGRNSIEDTVSEENSIANCTERFMQNNGYAPREMQEYLKNHAGENLIVTASTGSGKTEGALLWIENKKGFYTLPLKVSINAIYERIQNMKYDSAVLLHSDAKSYYLAHEDDISKYETARLLASPLTVTTIDQLLPFVYRVNGTEAAAAALASGRLIIDEIQMYSPEIIAIILYSLKMITSMGGQYLIMTATFPKILYSFMDEKNIPYSKPAKSYHGECTKRHRIRFYESSHILDYEQDILCQAKTKRVLVLCNTVGRACEVYESLQDADCEVHLLHSRFIKKDRNSLEQAILEFAPNNPNREHRHGIWVCTQIVEASLDIDFDVLFTELCSVDSLMQRMGRIYRNRLYDLGDEPNVYIFDSNNTGGEYVISQDIYNFSKSAVMAFDGQFLEESDRYDLKEQIMDMVYDPEQNPDIKGRYLQEIRDKWDFLERLNIYQYNKNDKQAKVRDIRSVTVIPCNVRDTLLSNGTTVRWNDEAALCRPQRNETPEQRDIRRKKLLKLHEEILSYTVDIQEHSKYEIKNEYPFDSIWPNSNIHLCNNIYDEHLGLTERKGDNQAMML